MSEKNKKTREDESKKVMFLLGLLASSFFVDKVTSLHPGYFIYPERLLDIFSQVMFIVSSGIVSREFGHRLIVYPKINLFFKKK